MTIMSSQTKLWRNAIHTSAFLLFILGATQAETTDMEAAKLRCCTAVEKPIIEERKANVSFHSHLIAAKYANLRLTSEV